jgi:hypothetical protein
MSSPYHTLKHNFSLLQVPEASRLLQEEGDREVVVGAEVLLLPSLLTKAAEGLSLIQKLLSQAQSHKKTLISKLCSKSSTRMI